MNRGSLGLISEKEKDIVKKILQVLAAENLTNGEAVNILDYAEKQIRQAMFNGTFSLEVLPVKHVTTSYFEQE
jgi:hypothetical protein